MSQSLAITYSGGEIDFLNTSSAVRLHYWKPAIVAYKDGGVFRDSKVAPGRRPVYRQNANVIETIECTIHGTQSEVADAIVALTNIPDEAFDYWKPSSSIELPVYLTARVNSESGEKYAPIYKIDVDGLDDLYTGTFQGGVLFDGTAYASGFSKITLTIERGDWSDEVPGDYSSIVSGAVVNNNAVGGENLLTHIFVYDASTSTYSANQVAATDFALFGDPVEVGDILYFGGSATFSSLYFYIGTVAGTLPSYIDIVWEKWNGSAWDDINSELVYEDGFNNAGDGIWTGPGPTYETTVNGASAYWLRFRVQYINGTVQTPEQANQVISTTSSGGVGGDPVNVSVTGDLDALLRIKLTGETATTSSRRVILGFKETSMSRFNAYLNISEIQTDAAITATAIHENAIFDSFVGPAVGEALVFTPPDTDTDYLVGRLTLGSDITPYYKGRYRWFMRCMLDGLTDATVTVNVVIGSETVASSVSTVVSPLGNYVYADLGILSIYDNNPLFNGDEISLEINTRTASTGGSISYWDFILIPMDISIAEISSPNAALGVTDGTFAIIDSVSSPRDDVLAAVFDSSNSRKMANMVCVRNGKMSIPPNKSYTMWMTALDADYVGLFDIEFQASVDVDIARQYRLIKA